MKKYLPAAPLAVWSGLFVGCPLIYIFILSFLTRGPTGSVVFKFTLENYRRIFEPLYMEIFSRSLGIALLTSLVTLLLGYPFAYCLSNLPKKKKALLLLLMMIPFWTNSLLRTYGWIILLRKDGVLNAFLGITGLAKEPLIMLYNYPAVIMGMIYMLLPFMILPLFNSIEKLDRSYLEASRDLGAGKAATFLRVTLPLTLPGVISGVMLVFVLAVGLFFLSDLLGGAKTMLVGNLIQLQMTSARDWPFGAAISVVLIAGVLIFVWLYTKTVILTGKIGGGLFDQ